MIVMGVDPGSRRCGWGFVRIDGSLITHVDNGVIAISERAALAVRLRRVFEGLEEVIARYAPTHAAVAGSQPDARRQRAMHHT